MFMPMIWRNNNNVYDVRDPFEEMDRMMDSFWGTGLETTTTMKTDVIEEEKDYRLEADLPGFKKEDMNVEVKDGVLSISASHDENNDEKDRNGKYLRRERHFTSYQRSFTVGENVRPEDITAKYENGVLTLTIPKKEEIPQKEEIRKIEIQ